MSVPTPFHLVNNTLALSPGVAFNADDMGVIDYPVADGIVQSRVIQILMPARHIELRAEDGRGRFGSGLHQLQYILYFAFLRIVNAIIYLIQKDEK